MKKFVFEHFDDYIAKAGKYWYYIDQEYGVLFKSKYNFKRIAYGCFYFTKGEKAYITDLYGDPLICTNIESLNACIEKENKRKQKESENYKKSNNCKDFKGKDFITMGKVFDTDYYIVRKDNLSGVVDTDGNTIIDFKYLHIYPAFSIEDKLCLVAIENETNKYGVIDINENTVIPFMYDLISLCDDDSTTNTVLVKKNDKYGVINYLNNETIIDFNYECIYAYGDFVKYSPVKNENGYWGLMDRQGNILDIDLSKIKNVDVRNLKRKPKISSFAYMPDYLMSLAPRIEKLFKRAEQAIDISVA